MGRENPELMRVIEYIMHRAHPAELEVIQSAIHRRTSAKPQGMADLDFQQMARNVTEGFGDKFGADQDQIHAMTRRLVKGMIRDQTPGIPEEHVEALLNQWVPNSSSRSSSPGQERALPVEALHSMIDQFVRYGLGSMNAKESDELKREMPDWTSVYWNIFSVETRSNIKDLLEGRMDLDLFWGRIRQRLDRYRANEHNNRGVHET